MNPTYVYRARPTRVIDGDTFVASVDLGFRAGIEITIRLHGVNSPEHNRPGGKEATAYLNKVLGFKSVQIEHPNLITIQSFKDAMSFTRWVCDVWLDGDDKPLAQRIIEDGHGVPFDPKVDHWTP